MSTLIIYGFTAGAVATVNPCGIALLPAWFARQMASYVDRSLATFLIAVTGRPIMPASVMVLFGSVAAGAPH